uniref:CCHC-type domain-containing protein n=1 Tax=Tanacetum cinerariifolium TaxID=118510 RepID=A0A6L2JEJ6_TANCI|nr:hypothetical protein [Tanacetum cinerariifolium]
MESMISLGQKNTLAEYMILSGADNRPPMLDKDLYNSWKSKMKLYMQNKEHGRMILESVAHGLPSDIYSLVNHHRVANDIWERIQLLMQGTQFNTYQSSYNNPQLQQQFSPSQYGSIHPTQHYSSTYPSQPQFNHSSVQSSYPYQSQMNHQTTSVPQIAYQSPQVFMQPMTESPLVDSASSRFPSTNNQLRTSLNQRKQTTIQDGRVTVQQVQGRHSQSYSGIGYKSNATSSEGNNSSGQARVVKCYNCQGEGHMARQCSQPKRPRNAAWYKEKAMLAEDQEARQILDEEQIAFLADPGVLDGQAV